MNQDQRGQFSLRLIQKCPVCARDYNGGRIEILSESDQSFLAYMSCGSCSSSIIVRVLTLPHGLVGNAILTDLNGAEVLSFSEVEPVLSNQVLEMHQLISQDAAFIDKMRNN